MDIHRQVGIDGYIYLPTFSKRKLGTESYIWTTEEGHLLMILSDPDPVQVKRRFRSLTQLNKTPTKMVCVLENKQDLN